MTSGGAIRCRPAREDDLDACTRIWKAGIEDYQAKLNQPAMPDDLGPLRRLFAHALGTDPDRFWVAVDPDGDDRPIGFTSATVRGDLWFLGMLFVEPGRQADGVGTALLDRALAGFEPGAPGEVPGPGMPLRDGITRWGMCTDAMQPISNALYARRGMVPRIPAWRLFGEVRHPRAMPALPASLEVVDFQVIADGDPAGHRRLADAVNGLDREILGLEHGQDHAYLRRDGRIGVLVRERNGRAIGYGYGSGAGRMGPFASLDPDLLPAVIGTTVRELALPGPIAAWIPGSASAAMRTLLEAGLILDGFPALICWSDGPHPFERYAPISLALV